MALASVLEFPPPPSTPVHIRVLEFARALRANDFVIGTGDVADAIAGMSHLDILNQHEVRWLLRSVFCSNQRDWKKFDDIFNLFWLMQKSGDGVRLGKGGGGTQSVIESSKKQDPNAAMADLLKRMRADEDEGEISGASGTGRREGASSIESADKVDLAHLTDAEALKKIKELTDRLALRIRYKHSRRYRFGRKGQRLDLRRTLHHSVSTGGTPIQLYRRQRREKPFKLVVLLDVSGSMDQYSSFFLRFIHGVLQSFEEADAFVFHTRLVHLSNVLAERDPDKFVDRLTLLAQGWSGGTRIGECLGIFNQHYAKGIMNSRTMVIVVSDGFDTGEPEQLAGELAAMKRRAKRIVWFNPLLGLDGYEPTARCMAAALPHIDLFAPAHNLESLAALENELASM